MPTPQLAPHLTVPFFDPNQRTIQPTSQPHVRPTPQQSVQPTRGHIVPSTEHEMVVRDKILIEPKGDTYMLYSLSLNIKCSKLNFKVKGAKQLKNLFAYASKSGKVPDFVSVDNWAQLQKSGPEGVGPSLLTYGVIPITEWHRQMGTVDELYKDIHMHRIKDKQGNWVCKKSELKFVRSNSNYVKMSFQIKDGFELTDLLFQTSNVHEEHTKRWQEYRSFEPSTDDSSQSPPLSERDILVQGDLTSKGHVSSFGVEGVVMKRQSFLSISSHSSSINNYDARKMAMRFNESVSKATEEEACQQEFRKQVEEEVRAKLIVELNNQWVEKEAKIQNDLDQEKAARQRDKKKVKSKMSKMWRFFKSKQAGS
ncbi:hypothetical protein Cgig2_001245 [Carnegiea gigantea]|uniref:Uncharacterized protein n=1 Tax=Carnegiea gigantea TaxID=171969 RepID=A0A9Q1JML2_9CARY|nr:hypothetical protein Cgig2_001245 [Carnegiea gigantea]